MNPSGGYRIKTNISAMLKMAGQDKRFDEIGADLANKKQIPLADFSAFVFGNLDKLGAFYDSELAKIGRPLTADEFNDVIKRGVDEFEKELRG
ncbi:MAG: hypothetical protein ABR887_04580 [Methanoregulaceae archaeon]|jgi:hypothetical protein